MYRGESRFSQKIGFGECGESGESCQTAWRMSASLASPSKTARECERVWRVTK